MNRLLLNRLLRNRTLWPIGLGVAIIALGASGWIAAKNAAEGPAGAPAGHHEEELVVRKMSGVTEAQGLAAWDRIHAVVSHPRCVSCHVDERGIPMWLGKYHGTDRPHPMNVRSGASRMGTETLPCATCHMTSNAPNTVPHAPPHSGIPWQLAPVAFTWFGKTSAEICQQMRDPARNGGRDGPGLVEHILHDVHLNGFIKWGFNPGGGRDSAPGTLQQHVDDTVEWTTAGMPCPK